MAEGDAAWKAACAFLRASLGHETQVSLVPHATARVVVLPSLSHAPPPRTAILVALLSLPVLAGVAASYSDAPHSGWYGVPRVIVAQCDAWTGARAFLRRARPVCDALGVGVALYAAQEGEMDVAVGLAVPRGTFVAPRVEDMVVVNILDEEAVQFLATYNARRDAAVRKAQDMGIARADCLRDVSVPFLMEALSSLEVWSLESTRLSQLHDMRQARSYALVDGAAVAADYLQSCVQRGFFRGGALPALAARVRAAAVGGGTNAGPHGGRNAECGMAEIVRRCVTRAVWMLRKESVNARQVHRRAKVTVLVVVETEETSAKLQGCDMRMDAPECGAVRTCTLRELQADGGEATRLDSFSHIFHVRSGRDDRVGDFALPARALQNVYAGRTRLVTIAVDESRSLGRAWSADVALHARVRREWAARAEKLGTLLVRTDVDTLRARFGEI